MGADYLGGASLKARDLVALASAHGVNLLEAAKVAADKQKRALEVERKRSKLTGIPYDELVPPKANGAKGRETRTFKRPKWSVEELSQAAAGIPAIQFDTLMYCFGGTSEPYWRIQAALCSHARHLRYRYKWPAEVKDIHGLPSDYLGHMAVMVLDEDLNEQLFQLADNRLCSIYLRVPHETWEKELQPRYELVKLAFIRWRDNALSTVQSRLNASEEAV